MAAFADPFVGGQDLTKKEALIRALRLDIAAEYEAVFLYAAHAEATSDEFVRKVLLDIADEERVHIGELIALIEYLDSDERKLLDEGAEEAATLVPNGESSNEA